MIVLNKVTKVLKTNGPARRVLSSVDAVIPSNRRIALLSHSSDDRKVLLDLIAGLVLPTSGRIQRKVRVSFPVGYFDAFDGELSVRHNVGHIARLYGADISLVVRFVEQLVNLKSAFDRPFRNLPLAEKRKLSYIVGYSIPFDVYLLNVEPTRANDEIGQVSRALFEARSQSCGMVVPTVNARFAQEYCDMAIILFREQLFVFEDMGDAFTAFDKLKAIR